MEYSVILIIILVFVIIYFIIRELKAWDRKIHERISLLEKQNTILWSLILGANTNDEIKKEMSLMRPPDSPIKNEHSPSLFSKRRQHFN